MNGRFIPTPGDAIPTRQTLYEMGELTEDPMANSRPYRKARPLVDHTRNNKQRPRPTHEAMNDRTDDPSNLPDPERRVLNELMLNEQGTEAKCIARSLKMPRKEVNRILYRVLKGRFGVVMEKGTPPIWHIRRKHHGSMMEISEESQEDETYLFVVIDLGHIHGVLEKAVDLHAIYTAGTRSNACHFDVMGYADFGAAENAIPKYARRIKRAPTPGSNLADCMAIFDITKRLIEGQCHGVVIVSKDKLFGDMSVVLHQEFPNVSIDICTNWKDLREYIE